MVELAIPRLRDDIEIRHRRDGKVEIRDPHLFQILTVDGDDFRLAQNFDGQRNVQAVHEKLRSEAKRITRGRVVSVAAEFEELKLLDTPAVWKSEPIHENLAPWTQLDSKKGLAVLPVAESNSAWGCHSCGACCHGLAVELSPEEEARIDRSLYRDILGEDHFAEDAFINPDEPLKRVLRQKPEARDACVFLSPEGLCYVHARQGMEAKPNACQLFPLMVVHVPRQPPRVGLRVNCQTMYESFREGPGVTSHAPLALRVLQNADVHKAPSKVMIFGKEQTFKVFDVLCRSVIDTLRRDGLSAKVLADIDREFLEGRVKRSRKRYGRSILKYLVAESEAEIPIESGAYSEQVRRVKRGFEALDAMAAGEPPPDLRPEVAAFLTHQFANTLYICGPLNAPDGGMGLLALLLALETVMHATGRRGDLAVANTAYDVFTHPILETLEHMWPILDAIDAKFSARLRKEMFE